MSTEGIVYLVGAGPGDPDLMTVRSLELIARADAILYDRLIPPGALDAAPPEAELVYVGKRPGGSVEQRGIEDQMVERARAGQTVVRLKGGDPFVFGRGGEEAEALAAAGVAFEVVPGVTAGIAAAAYAGIPVTHRDDASAVAFVTGHEDPEKEEEALDWPALAAFPGTLVFYMGIRNLARAAERLVEAGRDPGQPAAVIERGTTPRQRTVVATLATLASEAAKAGIQPPALVIAGPVAARRERIAWFEKRPLHGLRVVVTRARPQASGLARRLRELGAEAIELPAIRTIPRIDSDEVRQAIESIQSYALVCLTSPNGVRLLFDALAAAGLDARALAGAKVAAVGPGTARALAERGILADVVPERAVAESLIEALAEVEVEGRRVLVARPAEAREVLPNALRERGAAVDTVALYETAAAEVDEDTLAEAATADYVTFTSASTVANFTAALGPRKLERARVVSIGPITSTAAREAGHEVHVEAERHDVDGLVEALIADAARR